MPPPEIEANVEVLTDEGISRLAIGVRPIPHFIGQSVGRDLRLQLEHVSHAKGLVDAGVDLLQLGVVSL